MFMIVIKKISLVDVITFTDMSWSDIKDSTIKNCFKHLYIDADETEKGEGYESNIHADNFVENFIGKTKIFDGISLTDYINMEYTEEEEILYEMESFEVKADNKQELKDKSSENLDSKENIKQKFDEKDVISSIDLLIKYLRSKELNVDEYRLMKSLIKKKIFLGRPSGEKTLLELGFKLRK